jgi:flagellar motor switch/type III secretory pathway protein FliN
VSEPTLDPEELEAIQAAVRAGRPRASAAPSLDARDAARLTLLASDRLAERAIPALLRLGTRWAGEAPRALAAHLPGTWRAAPLGCEVVTGTALRELSRSAWITVGAVAAGSTLALAVEGDVIQRAAARRCGDPGKPSTGERPTPPITAAAIRLFEPTGRAIASSWELTWRAVDERALAASDDPARALEAMHALPALVRLTLELSGDLSGRIVLFVPPAMLIHGERALEAHRADARGIGRALADVPVDVIVELGTFPLSLHALATLRPGATFALPTFVDSSVPVRCGGALKAWAKPVLARGVLAVEIERVVARHGEAHE